MTSIYEFAEHPASATDAASMSGERFLDMVEDEFLSLPPIRTLDDYGHFREQLEAMRARSFGQLVPARFAMEIALFSRLCDYETSLGLPQGYMPEADGNGGVKYPSPVPDEWIA